MPDADKVNLEVTESDSAASQEAPKPRFKINNVNSMFRQTVSEQNDGNKIDHDKGSPGPAGSSSGSLSSSNRPGAPLQKGRFVLAAKRDHSGSSSTATASASTAVNSLSSSQPQPQPQPSPPLAAQKEPSIEKLQTDTSTKRKPSFDYSEEELHSRGISVAGRFHSASNINWEDEEENWSPPQAAISAVGKVIAGNTAAAKAVGSTTRSTTVVSPAITTSTPISSARVSAPVPVQSSSTSTKHDDGTPWGERKVVSAKSLSETIREAKEKGTSVLPSLGGSSSLGRAHHPTSGGTRGGDALSRFRIRSGGSMNGDRPSILGSSTRGFMPFDEKPPVFERVSDRGGYDRGYGGGGGGYGGFDRNRSSYPSEEDRMMFSRPRAAVNEESVSDTILLSRPITQPRPIPDRFRRGVVENEPFANAKPKDQYGGEDEEEGGNPLRNDARNPSKEWRRRESTSRPEAAKPEVAKPEVVKPEVVEPEVVEPEAAKPETAKPEAGHSEAGKPEETKSNDEAPDVGIASQTEPSLQTSVDSKENETNVATSESRDEKPNREQQESVEKKSVKKDGINEDAHPEGLAPKRDSEPEQKQGAVPSSLGPEKVVLVEDDQKQEMVSQLQAARARIEAERAAELAKEQRLKEMREAMKKELMMKQEQEAREKERRKEELQRKYDEIQRNRAIARAEKEAKALAEKKAVAAAKAEAANAESAKADADAETPAYEEKLKRNTEKNADRSLKRERDRGSKGKELAYPEKATVSLPSGCIVDNASSASPHSSENPWAALPLRPRGSVPKYPAELASEAQTVPQAMRDVQKTFPARLLRPSSYQNTTSNELLPINAASTAASTGKQPKKSKDKPGKLPNIVVKLPKIYKTKERLENNLNDLSHILDEDAVDSNKKLHKGIHVKVPGKSRGSVVLHPPQVVSAITEDSKPSNGRHSKYEDLKKTRPHKKFSTNNSSRASSQVQ